MPSYEYRCPQGHAFQMIVISTRMTHATFECPHCGQRAEKVMSAPSVITSTGLPLKESAVSGAIRRVKTRPVIA